MEAYMDAYCERTAPGLLKEPLNAITNSSFLIAAWAAWFLAHRLGPPVAGCTDPDLARRRPSASGAVLWHTLPDGVDVDPRHHPDPHLPGLVLLALHAKRRGMPTPLVMAAIVVFVVASALAQRFGGVLHGALYYTPALIFLLVLGVYHARERATGPLHAARGGRCVLPRARLPHDGPGGLLGLPHRNAFSLAQLERPGRLPGDALPYSQRVVTSWSRGVSPFWRRDAQYRNGATRQVRRCFAASMPVTAASASGRRPPPAWERPS